MLVFFVALALLVASERHANAQAPSPTASPQSAIVLQIGVRVTADADGDHVVVTAAIENGSRGTVEVSPLSAVRAHVVDGTGAEIQPQAGCPPEVANAPEAVKLRLGPGRSFADPAVVDVACYRQLTGREYAVSLSGQTQLNGKTFDLVSNPVSYTIPAFIPTCADQDQAARLVKVAQLNYSDATRPAGSAGSAQVSVYLDATGAVQQASIVRGTGDMSLDQIALAAARNSTYAPRIFDCVAAPSAIVFRADFR